MKTIFASLFVLLSIVANAQYRFDYNGVNLAGAEFGNTLPGTHGTNYQYPNSGELDYFSSKGLKLIRVPFLWERMQRSKGGSLNTAELNRMKAFVQAAEDRCMFILFDMHNYGGYNNVKITKEGTVTYDHFGDFWKKFAAEFKDYDNIWGYGLMNEPNAMGSGDWKRAAQFAINGIREVDTNTPIVVGGDDWSSAERWPQKSDNLKYLTDPSNLLIFEAHQYFDANSSGTQWDYDAQGAYPNVGVDRVQPFLDWLEINNLKGFIGEFGAPGDDQRWLTVLDNFAKELQDNGVNFTYWAAGPWWGNYAMSVEPSNGVDKPQMAVLEKYGDTETACLLLPNSSFDSYEDVAVYPNPATNTINIEINGSITWELYNITGVKVMSGTAKSVNISALPTGLYLLKTGEQIHRIEKY